MGISRHQHMQDCRGSHNIIFNTIPPCPFQREEGMAVKEEEWRENTFHER